MRHIGSFANEAQARFFTDFLLSREIRSQLEPESDRSWSVWIRDEDQIEEAQAALQRFQANPMAAEFQKAPEAAARAREKEAEDLAKYRQRVRSRRSIFPKMGGYGLGILTFTLMLVCFYVAVFSKVGNDIEWLRPWFTTDPMDLRGKFLPEVAQGQFWRLFTPMFIHFGPLHLIFNMMWFYQLGSMIEGRQNSLFLFIFIAVSSALSDFAEYSYQFIHFHGHTAPSGGMSGVLYALAGYIWMRGKYNPGSGLYLDRQSVAYLLIWMVVCFTGVVGPVANIAHVSGLLVGMAWGGLAAIIATRYHE
jgi:GlpG protein